MQNESKYLITAGLSLGALSIIYFFCSILHLPFFVPVALACGSGVAIAWWLLRMHGGSVRYKIEMQVWSVLILVSGFYFMVANSDPLSLKYGGWDAWVMWDLYGKYLSGSGNEWSYIFKNTTGHADYPLMVPGITGFFMRAFNHTPWHLVSYVCGSVFMFLIPLLVFFEAQKKNVIVAGLAFFFFAFDAAYLQESVLHYADIPLAFFFLCAVICVDHARANPGYVAVAAACIGCGLWTKNEGVVLGAILVLFNYRLFLSKNNIGRVLAGLIIPVIVLVVFKKGYATSNDMVTAFTSKGLSKLFDGDRYVFIFNRFIQEINDHFDLLKLVLLLYGSFCIITRKWPDRRFNMLLFCMLVYLGVYLFTPYDLKWHMDTSVNRLILHLVPAAVYIVSQRIADIKLILPE